MQRDGARARDLEARLAAVRKRIATAAEAAGRTAPELIVVTKYFPSSDVRILADLGVRDVGENRDQEAAAKAAELDDLALTWHFIGQLQTNKAKSVVRYAHSVHSVDRATLVAALGKAVAAEQERRAGAGLGARDDLECFLQFTLDAAATSGGRGGALPGEAGALAEGVAATAGLRLAGVMAVAPIGTPPAAAFERLLRIADSVRAVDPSATAVSAGMSGDLEEAVAAGATHLRIGSDVLGPRPAVG
ncbi:YggS family pyridoxal phosphate-dependent enzyme [Arthrobacter burdickii]|uniref:Pyridoxal phosphate homeostasis protein n=1 Tax=Arthrobacter burdickii TaxID=3035920 RepID=A0ABT8K3N2_9MICC|nr:YggS family pyridoxal phosphate-dependent enzyme [Arthrobacter burdickii]MDN4612048.1 YggS family pyridoxal phosphate-dependent enzyme [Arthrobacter burdickii]